VAVLVWVLAVLVGCEGSPVRAPTKDVFIFDVVPVVWWGDDYYEQDSIGKIVRHRVYVVEIRRYDDATFTYRANRRIYRRDNLFVVGTVRQYGEVLVKVDKDGTNIVSHVLLAWKSDGQVVTKYVNTTYTYGFQRDPDLVVYTNDVGKCFYFDPAMTNEEIFKKALDRIRQYEPLAKQTGGVI